MLRGRLSLPKCRGSSVTLCRQPGSSIATPSRAKLFHEEPEAGNLHIRHCEGCPHRHVNEKFDLFFSSGRPATFSTT